MKIRRLFGQGLIAALIILPFYSFTQSPELKRISQFDLPGAVGNVTDVWGYYDEATGKEYALVGSNGFVVVDVSNPKDPIQVGYLDEVNTFDIKTWKHFAYVVDGAGTGIAKIIDLSIPEGPEVAGEFPTAHNIWIDSLGYLYAEDVGLKIYDLNKDPLKPELLWMGGHAGHDAFVKGDRLYDFHGSGGFNLYDIKDRSNPVKIADIRDAKIAYYHSGYVTEDNNYLFICDELAKGNFADITAWDISDLENIKQVWHYTDTNATVHNIYIKGGYAYVSFYSAGLRVFNVKNPLVPKLVAEYDVPSVGEGFKGMFGVFPFTRSGHIFTSGRDSGLMVFSHKPPPIPIRTNFMNVYPVPTNDRKIQVDITDPDLKELDLKIYDMKGSIVYSSSLTGLLGYYTQELTLPSLRSGVYWIHAITNFGELERKIVVVEGEGG